MGCRPARAARRGGRFAPARRRRRDHLPCPRRRGPRRRDRRRARHARQHVAPDGRTSATCSTPTSPTRTSTPGRGLERSPTSRSATAAQVRSGRSWRSRRRRSSSASCGRAPSDSPMRQLIDRGIRARGTRRGALGERRRGVPVRRRRRRWGCRSSPSPTAMKRWPRMSCGQLAAEAWALREEFVGAGRRRRRSAHCVRQRQQLDRSCCSTSETTSEVGARPTRPTCWRPHNGWGCATCSTRSAIPLRCSSACSTGIGASVELTVGGRTDDLHGAPVAVDGTRAPSRRRQVRGPRRHARWLPLLRRRSSCAARDRRRPLTCC